MQPHEYKGKPSSKGRKPSSETIGRMDTSLQGNPGSRISRSECLCGVCGGAWSTASLAAGGPLAALLWATAFVCHLSLIAVSGDFLGLQSDSNQCEVAALCSLLALYRAAAGDGGPVCCDFLGRLRAAEGPAGDVLLKLKKLNCG